MKPCYVCGRTGRLQVRPEYSITCPNCYGRGYTGINWIRAAIMVGAGYLTAEIIGYILRHV